MSTRRATMFHLGLLVLSILGSFDSPATAQTRSWVGDPDARWEYLDNWSPIGVPLPNESIFIGDLTPSGSALLAATVTVENLTLSNSASLGHLQTSGEPTPVLNVSGTFSLEDSSEASLLRLSAGHVEVLDSAELRLGSLFRNESSVASQGVSIGAGATLTLRGNGTTLEPTSQSGFALVNDGTIKVSDDVLGSEMTIKNANSA